MLNDDPKKLRFVGVDLHSRARRRTLIIFTYLFYALALAGVEVFFEDHPVSSTAWTVPGGLLEIVAMTALSIAFSSGIFRDNGPVKPFGSHKLFRRYGDRLILESRDDWARYLYEESFANLSAEKQTEVRRRFRPGRYLVKDKPFFAPGLPDEREIAEIGSASGRALNLMVGFLTCSAVVFACRGIHIRPEDLMTQGFELAIAAATLPKAVILWNEPDPRQYSALKEAPVEARS